MNKIIKSLCLQAGFREDVVLYHEKEFTALLVLRDNDQEFLDRTAIAAMQSLIIVCGDYNTSDLDGKASDFYKYAHALLAEKKRLQGEG